MADQTLQYKRTDSSETEVVLEVTIPKKEFSIEYEEQLKTLSKTVRVKGFRPGNAPADMVESTHGKEAQTKAIEKLVSQYASEAMQKEKLYPAVSPSVELGTPSENGDFNVKVIVPVIPDITLPDLKKLTVTPEKIEVTKEDVETVMKRLWQDNKGKFKDRSDEWVKSVAPKLGFKATTLKDLEKEIEGAIKFEKARITTQEFADKAMREAIELAGVQVPKQLLEGELAERERSFENALSESKMTEEEFCKSREITMEEIRKQWEKDSRDAIETDVLLAAYAKERSVKVEKKELEQEVEMLKQRAKDPSDKIFDNPEWKSYIERVLLKRKAYAQFVEEVGKNSEKDLSVKKPKEADKKEAKKGSKPKKTNRSKK